MRKGTNSTYTEAPKGSGYGVVEKDAARDFATLDRLPRPIREAIAEAGCEMAADSILVAYLRGMPVGTILERIREGDEATAMEHGTMPGDYWRGRPLAMKPDKRDTAAAVADPRFRGRKGRPKPRRLPRTAGSY